MSIKNLRYKIVDRIINERKEEDYFSLENFLKRIKIDLSDAISLANAGCFKNIEPNMSHQEVAYYIVGFCVQNNKDIFLSSCPINNKLTDQDRYRLELEVFGYPISFHPLSRYRPLLSKHIKYAKDISKFSGYSVYLVGLYITHKEILTNTNGPMNFLTLEDESDIYECIIFPKIFKKYSEVLYWEKLFIIKGVVEQKFGVYTIKIDNLASLQKWARERYKTVY